MRQPTLGARSVRQTGGPPLTVDGSHSWRVAVRGAWTQTGTACMHTRKLVCVVGPPKPTCGFDVVVELLRDVFHLWPGEGGPVSHGGQRGGRGQGRAGAGQGIGCQGARAGTSVSQAAVGCQARSRQAERRGAGIGGPCGLLVWVGCSTHDYAVRTGLTPTRLWCIVSCSIAVVSFCCAQGGDHTRGGTAMDMPSSCVQAHILCLHPSHPYVCCPPPPTPKTHTHTHTNTTHTHKHTRMAFMNRTQATTLRCGGW